MCSTAVVCVTLDFMAKQVRRGLAVIIMFTAWAVRVFVHLGAGVGALE